MLGIHDGKVYIFKTNITGSLYSLFGKYFRRMFVSQSGEIGLLSVYTCSSFHKMLKLITDGKHLAKDSFSANDVDACSNV